MSAALQRQGVESRLPTTTVIDGLSNFRDWGGHATLPAIGSFQSAIPLGSSRQSDTGRRRPACFPWRSPRRRPARNDRAPERPRPVPGHLIEILSTPVEPRSSETVRQMLSDGRLDRVQLREHMIASYRGYVTTEAAEIFGDAIHAIATAGERAILVHCTAGKDRTGFLVALLQRALGASEDAVIADYLRTNADWDRASVAGRLPLHDEGIQPILVAPTPTICPLPSMRSNDGMATSQPSSAGRREAGSVRTNSRISSKRKASHDPIVPPRRDRRRSFRHCRAPPPGVSRSPPPSKAPVTISYYNYNLASPASAPKRRRN